jgi:aryl-alcohol dehydrogenase-like predicted oxidoreductase
MEVAMYKIDGRFSRRGFLKAAVATGAGIAASPYMNCGVTAIGNPMKRTLGRIPFEATTLGMGGQASLQWPARVLDPVQIVLRAFKLGINYFDTSNLYNDSQFYYSKAFERMDLIPGKAGYNERLRRSIFVTSKTHLRWGKGNAEILGVENMSDGEDCHTAIDDVRRSLSQLFGDGKGNFPEGAYLDMILLHSVTNPEEVDALYDGYEKPDPNAEKIGALAVLFDYRDGTNRTGQNPKREKLVRHIGFSGHYSPIVMMDMIQRDRFNVLDGMLVAVNANDLLYCNMQNNVIPVAAAKNMAVIGMKVFADGAMYSKGAIWSENYQHVIRSLGQKPAPYRQLLQYTLTTPGVNIAITGIGYTDLDPNRCQIYQNLLAAQILPNGLSPSERKQIEELAMLAKEGKTNYFQMESSGLTPPRGILMAQEKRNEQRMVHITWNSAIAAKEPVQLYEVWRDNQKLSEIPHQPQTTTKPFSYVDNPTDQLAHIYKLVTVDKGGDMASTEDLMCEQFV